MKSPEIARVRERLGLPPMLQNFNQYGYLGVFVALIASGFGFPIPEELPVLTAGIMVGHEDTTLYWYFMLPIVIVGVVIGDGVLYGIGRLWGQRLMKLPWMQRKIPQEKRLEIEKNFADRGIMVLLGARMLPGIRSPIFIMAGMLRVPLGRFLLADGIYAIPLVNVLFWSAYMLTDQVLVVFGQIRKVQEEYGPLIGVIVLSAVIGVLVYKYVFSRSLATGDPPHVPKIISKPAESLGHAFESAVDKVTGRHQHEKSEERESAPADAVSSAESAAPASSFELTDDSVHSLEADGVPGDVLVKLEPLKNQAFSRSAFDDALASSLTPEEAKRFQDAIFNRMSQRNEN